MNWELQYGLSFNEGKLEVLRINYAGHLYKINGETIKEKEAMVYLGSLLSVDGRAQADLGRRIGAAKMAFKELEAVWRHASIKQERKVKIYEACVASRLLYCVHTS